MLFVTDAGLGVKGVNAGVVGLDVNPTQTCNLIVGWSLSLSVVGDNQPPSEPTVANGIVFVGIANGGAVKTYNAATGAKLWNSGSTITGGATFAAPIVSSGTLYVGSWDGYTTAVAGTIRAFAVGSRPPPPPPPPTVLVGSQVIQSTVDDDALGTAEAFQATAAASGTVGVPIYLDGSTTATTLVAGLYTDSGGHPGTLISQGTSSSLTAGTWA
jgi:outer membrane protein assembly factor BamB